MASLFKRAKDFAQSPKGKQLTEEVKEQAQQAGEPSQGQGVWTALYEEALAPSLASADAVVVVDGWGGVHEPSAAARV